MSEAQRGPGKFSQAAALKSHFFPVCTAVTPCVLNQFDFYLPLFQTKKVRKQRKKKESCWFPKVTTKDKSKPWDIWIKCCLFPASRFCWKLSIEKKNKTLFIVGNWVSLCFYYSWGRSAWPNGLLDRMGNVATPWRETVGTTRWPGYTNKPCWE